MNNLLDKINFLKSLLKSGNQSINLCEYGEVKYDAYHLNIRCKRELGKEELAFLVLRVLECYLNHGSKILSIESDFDISVSRSGRLVFTSTEKIDLNLIDSLKRLNDYVNLNYLEMLASSMMDYFKYGDYVEELIDSVIEKIKSM